MISLRQQCYEPSCTAGFGVSCSDKFNFLPFVSCQGLRIKSSLEPLHQNGRPVYLKGALHRTRNTAKCLERKVVQLHGLLDSATGRLNGYLRLSLSRRRSASVA